MNERAKACGIDEATGLAELLELGFALQQGIANGARLKALGLVVHGNWSDGTVDVEARSSL